MKPNSKRLIKGIIDGIRDQIEAVYWYEGLLPSGLTESLLMVMSDGYSAQKLRAIFQPVWQNLQGEKPPLPYIARVSDLRRHVQLYPMLGAWLKTKARRTGRDVLANLDLPISQEERLAWVCAQLLDASRTLAPSMLDPEKVASKQALLSHLTRYMGGDGSAETAVQLAHLHATLNKQLDTLPPDPTWHTETLPDASFPGLQAIYREANEIVLVFATLDPATLHMLPALAQDLESEYEGMRVITARQLRLLVRLHSPLDVTLRRYTHEWGLDPLENLDIEAWRVMQTAARIPSEQQLLHLPPAYLTCPEDKLGKLIHDFQNRMLNIQLEHELLIRIAQIDRFTPPVPLPSKETPEHQRVDAIFSHFGWWSDYYAGVMEVKKRTML